MNTQDEIIKPWLTENLESLQKYEDEIRTKSVLEINATSALSDHLKITQESLNIIFDLTTVYKTTIEQQLTIQYLGVRLFNSIVTSLKLLLTGYYQGSVMVQRDILETGFLLDYFLSDKPKIKEWKENSNQDKFRPYRVREALDSRDGFKGQKRRKSYRLLCKMASHPTYDGLKLLAPSKGLKIGPFFDAKYLKYTFEELVLRVPNFTVVYVGHFEELPAKFLSAKVGYLTSLINWSQKYLNSDMSQIDIDSISEILESIPPDYLE